MAGLLALSLLAASLQGREALRLPWVFSDEPDLTADFQFRAGRGDSTRVDLMIGGRFARFGLARRALRAPRLEVRAEFTAPGKLTLEPRSIATVLDLAETLAEYGLGFDKRHFSKSSKLVYKSELGLELEPGDYNVTISLKDAELELASRRTLHLIVPDLRTKEWTLADLKFIKGVGEKLDAKGRPQTVLDPDPWRQAGPLAGWDLMAAYTDLGPRPPGKLLRRHSVERLRDPGPAPAWVEEGGAPGKSAKQSWLLRLPEALLKELRPGVYLLRVKLWPSGREAQAVESSKTFEVLP